VRLRHDRQLPQASFDDPALDLAATKGQPDTCHPICTWSCQTQTCEQTCEPLCSAPVCETRCPSLTVKGCSEECDAPDCTVICPEGQCSTGHCPSCKTVCNTASCRVKCPDQVCESVCADPKCEWKCKDPESCPEPQCKMTCKKAVGCLIGGPPGALPPTHDTRVMASGLAKLGDSDGTFAGKPAAAPTPDEGAGGSEG